MFVAFSGVWFNSDFVTSTERGCLWYETGFCISETCSGMYKDRGNLTTLGTSYDQYFSLYFKRIF